MSSSGHSVRSESANSPTVASSRPLRCCASSPMMPMNRSRAALSMSGNDAIVSIAARMLASDARVPCVSVCSRRSRRLPVSIRRVMLSSISTNPEIPSAAAAPVASGGAPSTGAICTRTSWPPGAVVTKFATGPRAPWRSRSWMLSSAWMIRLRSKMAKIERPSPTRLCAFPAAAALSSGFRSSCIARALYSRMRPSTLHMITLCASSDISAARRLRSCSMRCIGLAHALVEVALQRFVGVGEGVEALRQPPDLGGAAQRGAVRRIRREHDPRIFVELRGCRHVTAETAPSGRARAERPAARRSGSRSRRGPAESARAARVPAR